MFIRQSMGFSSCKMVSDPLCEPFVCPHDTSFHKYFVAIAIPPSNIIDNFVRSTKRSDGMIQVSITCFADVRCTNRLLCNSGLARTVYCSSHVWQKLKLLVHIAHNGLKFRGNVMEPAAQLLSISLLLETHLLSCERLVHHGLKYLLAFLLTISWTQDCDLGFLQSWDISLRPRSSNSRQN
jgi:hypothetical protein